MLGLGAAHADRLRAAASRSAARQAVQQPLRQRTDDTPAGAAIEDASIFLDCFVNMLNENTQALLEPPYRAIQRRNAARGTHLALDSSDATVAALQRARFDVASALRHLTCLNRQFRDAARINKKLPFLLAYYAHVPTRLFSDQTVDGVERDAMWVLECGIKVRDQHRLMDRLPASVQRTLVPVHEDDAASSARIAPIAGFTGIVDPHVEPFTSLPRACYPRQHVTQEEVDDARDAAAEDGADPSATAVLGTLQDGKLRMLPGFQDYNAAGNPAPARYATDVLLPAITAASLLIDRFHTAAQLEFNERAGAQAYYLRFAATDEATVPKDLKPAVRAWIGRMRYVFLRARLHNFWLTGMEGTQLHHHAYVQYGMPHALLAMGLHRSYDDANNPFGEAPGANALEPATPQNPRHLATLQLPPTNWLQTGSRWSVAARALWCWRRFGHHLADILGLDSAQRVGPIEHGTAWADMVPRVGTNSLQEAHRRMREDEANLSSALDDEMYSRMFTAAEARLQRPPHPNPRGLPADAPADPPWLDIAPDADGRVGLGVPPGREHSLFGGLQLRACSVPQCRGHCDWDADATPGAFGLDPAAGRRGAVAHCTLTHGRAQRPFDRDVTWHPGPASFPYPLPRSGNYRVLIMTHDRVATAFHSPIMEPCDKGSIAPYVALAGGAPLMDTAGATRLVPRPSFCSLACRLAAARALARHQFRLLALYPPTRAGAGLPSAIELANLQLALHRAVYAKLMGPIDWGRAAPPAALTADTHSVPDPDHPGERKLLMPPAETCAVSPQALRESRDREITMMNVHLGVLVAAATVERQLRLAQGRSASEAPASELAVPNGVTIPGINSRIENFCRTPVYYTNPVSQVAAIYERHARHTTASGCSPLPLCVDIERRSQPEWLREVVSMSVQGHVYGTAA